MSHKCNKFVISENGEFTRNFEGMYVQFDDPWGQNERYQDYDTAFDRFIDLLNAEGQETANSL